jgi:hypothetical protein
MNVDSTRKNLSKSNLPFECENREDFDRKKKKGECARVENVPCRPGTSEETAKNLPGQEAITKEDGGGNQVAILQDVDIFSPSIVGLPAEFRNRKTTVDYAAVDLDLALKRARPIPDAQLPSEEEHRRQKHKRTRPSSSEVVIVKHKKPCVRDDQAIVQLHPPTVTAMEVDEEKTVDWKDSSAQQSMIKKVFTVQRGGSLSKFKYRPGEVVFRMESAYDPSRCKDGKDNISRSWFQAPLDEFLSFTKMIWPTTVLSFHEHHLPGDPLRLFIDLDGFDHSLDYLDMIDSFEMAFVLFFNTEYKSTKKINLTRDNFNWLESTKYTDTTKSTVKKHSLHMVIQGFSVSCADEVKALMERFKVFLKRQDSQALSIIELLKPGVLDLQVYDKRKSLRVDGSVKLTDPDRPVCQVQGHHSGDVKDSYFTYMDGRETRLPDRRDSDAIKKKKAKKNKVINQCIVNLQEILIRRGDSTSTISATETTGLFDVHTHGERKCLVTKGQVHASNNAFVTLKPNGRLNYGCHASDCKDKGTVSLGHINAKKKTPKSVETWFRTLACSELYHDLSGACDNGDRGLSDLIVKRMKMDLKVADRKSRESYYFDPSKQLWVECLSDGILKPIQERIRRCFVMFEDLFEQEMGDEKPESFPDTQKEYQEYRDGISDRAGEIEDYLFGDIHTSVNLKRNIQPAWTLSVRELYVPDLMCQFNHIKHLWPLPNKRVFNFKTGETLPRTRDHMFSIEGPCELVDTVHEDVGRFFASVTNDNPVMVKYLQEKSGYFLTGETICRTMDFLKGSGRNGKGVYVKMLSLCMGDFYRELDKDVLLKPQISSGGNGSAAPHLLALSSVRCGVFQEIEEGEILATRNMKMYIAGDTSRERNLFKGDYQRIDPMIKILVPSNNDPKYNSVDAAITSRIRAMPWIVQFLEPEKLVEERAKLQEADHNLCRPMDQDFVETLCEKRRNSFFTWMVRGAVAFYKNNRIITEPDEVKKTTNAMNAEMNSVLQFLMQDPGCRFDLKDRTLQCGKNKLWNAYKVYVKLARCAQVTKNAWLNELANLGIVSIRTPNSTRVWAGISYDRDY